MNSDAAELSSVATRLEELTAQVEAVAKRQDASGIEDAAVSLFEVEQALRMASRRLDRAMQRVR